VSDGTARTYSHSRGVDAPGCGDDDALIDATIIVDGQTVPNDGGNTATETFVEHIVEPSDTFQGICLRYKISATHLRQANGGFSGTNLSLAPNPLKIPNPPNKAGDYVKYVPEAARGGQTEELRDVIPTALTDGQVISLLQRQFVNMTSTEARAYMELSDWELDQAVQAAADDNFARSKVT
jgi:LysM repeat protein